MYTKGQKKGAVRFGLTRGDAKKALLAGNFNDWIGQPMRKQKDGSFTLVVELPAGVYEYKFIVDGQWIVDPDTNTWAMNKFGTFNSVAQIAE